MSGTATQDRIRATTTPPADDQTPRRDARDKRPRKAYRVVRNLTLAVVLLAVVVAGVILGIDNQTPTSMHFLNVESPEWPVFWWLCAAFAAGVFLGVTLCAASLVRARMSQRLLRRSLRHREADLDRLSTS